MKHIVFGAGNFGRKFIKNASGAIEIVAVCDNNWEYITQGGGNNQK